MVKQEDRLARVILVSRKEWNFLPKLRKRDWL